MKKINVVLMVIMLFLFGIAFNKMNSKTRRVLVLGKVVGISSEYEKNNQENIGIMTYLDDNENKFVTLCHGLYNDGKLKAIDKANFYEIEELKIKKSEKNKIGSLNAVFNVEKKIGELSENTDNGVYGTINDLEYYGSEKSYFEVASKFEVRKGDAQIYIDITGDGVKAYEVEIQEIDYMDSSRNIYVEITDPELLEITGGMVKGLSGAPIIQNGKFVGAINYGTDEDTKKGCAIFAEKI